MRRMFLKRTVDVAKMSKKRIFEEANHVEEANVKEANCRTSELSDKRTVGQANCRTSELSDKRTVGQANSLTREYIQKCRTSEYEKKVHSLAHVCRATI